MVWPSIELIELKSFWRISRMKIWFTSTQTRYPRFWELTKIYRPSSRHLVRITLSIWTSTLRTWGKISQIPWTERSKRSQKNSTSIMRLSMNNCIRVSKPITTRWSSIMRLLILELSKIRTLPRLWPSLLFKFKILLSKTLRKTNLERNWAPCKLNFVTFRLISSRTAFKMRTSATSSRPRSIWEDKGISRRRNYLPRLSNLKLIISDGLKTRLPWSKIKSKKLKIQRIILWPQWTREPAQMSKTS